MPVNYYPNKTRAELEATLEALQKRAGPGAVNFSTTIGMQQQLTYQGAARVEVEMRRVLYALHKLEPANFENPYVSRIRRVRPRYV